MTGAAAGETKWQAFFNEMKAVSDTITFGKPGGDEFIVGGYSFSIGPSLSNDDGIGITLLTRVGEPGGATAAMRRVLSAADRAGVEVELFARPDENSREARRWLVAWYEREGFVAVRGGPRRRRFLRDGMDSLHMVRQPRPPEPLDNPDSEGYELPTP